MEHLVCVHDRRVGRSNRPFNTHPVDAVIYVAAEDARGNRPVLAVCTDGHTRVAPGRSGRKGGRERALHEHDVIVGREHIEAEGLLEIADSYGERREALVACEEIVDGGRFAAEVVLQVQNQVVVDRNLRLEPNTPKVRMFGKLVGDSRTASSPKISVQTTAEVEFQSAVGGLHGQPVFVECHRTIALRRLILCNCRTDQNQADEGGQQRPQS
jgi:hypothetical protein